VANAQLLASPFLDQGVFVDSTTFLASPPRPNLLEVIGVRVIASSGPTILGSLSNPVTTITVGALSSPNRLEVDFNFVPDPGTVNVASFTITGTGGLMGGGTVSFPSTTTARLDLPSSLAVGTYILRLNGTSVPQITFSAVPLDGEATGLPSGNGIPGGDFVISIVVVSGIGPMPTPASALPSINAWNQSLISIGGPPTCIALESTNQQSIADATQWMFHHETVNTNQQLAPPLSKYIFLRAGTEWQMNIPLNLGYLAYSNLQISLMENAGTRGDCQGTVPVIQFNQRIYSGNVTLQVSLKKLGVFVMGIRAIDTNGYYSMYESLWDIVP
jgi:hypothetical protein